MRIVQSKEITEKVKKLCIDGNINLGEDVLKCIKENLQIEESDLGKNILNILLENADIANKKI